MRKRRGKVYKTERGWIAIVFVKVAGKWFPWSYALRDSWDEAMTAVCSLILISPGYPE